MMSDTCAHCDGEGGRDYICDHCGGLGERYEGYPCGACHGVGHIEQPCPYCDGTGLAALEKTMSEVDTDSIERALEQALIDTDEMVAQGASAYDVLDEMRDLVEAVLSYLEEDDHEEG